MERNLLLRWHRHVHEKVTEWTTVIKNFLKELGQEALDNYFDTRQGKAASILDYTFRAEIRTVSLKKDTAIDPDEKVRGYWLMRTNPTEREISGIKIITQEQTQLAQVKKAITQAIVAKKGGEVRMISVRQETECKTALVDTLRPQILVGRLGMEGASLGESG